LKNSSRFIHIRSELDQIEYSCLQVNDFFLAQELYFQLHDDGVDFASLARRYSLGEEQQTGGRAERAALTTLPPEVSHILANGRIGEVYGPIAVANLFWIVRPEYRMVASLTEATRAMLTERVYRRWLQTQVQTLMAQPNAILLELSPVTHEEAGVISQLADA
jgi:parvulin-like peptidyl-prolyl isomerase